MRAIRSDNGTEFKNTRFDAFYSDQGLEHQYSSPDTPQQNGVVEKKNQTLVEMARTMLDEHRTPRKYWAKAVNTACYVSNRIFLRAFMHKTSYELRFGRQPHVDHLRVLKEGNLDKFEYCSSDGIFLGYASHSRAYCVLLIDSNIVRETCEVTFDKTTPCNASVFEDKFGTSIFEDEEEEAAEGDAEATTHAVDPVASATSSDDDDGPDPTTSTSRGPVE